MDHLEIDPLKKKKKENIASSMSQDAAFKSLHDKLIWFSHIWLKI